MARTTLRFLIPLLSSLVVVQSIPTPDISQGVDSSNNNIKRALNGAPIICGPDTRRSFRPVNTATYNFETSRCDRRISSQAWICKTTIEDADGFGPFVNFLEEEINHPGSCNPEEICVDGINHPDHPGTTVAICQSKQTIYRLAASELMQAQRGIKKNYLPQSTDGSWQPAVEAVFSNGDLSKSLLLPSLKIEAFHTKIDHTFGTITDELLDTNQCTKCNSLGFQPVPKNIDSIVYTLTPPAGLKALDLFVQSVGQVLAG